MVNEHRPSVIMGKPSTYDAELMLKLSKLDLSMIYVRHGGDASKVSSNWSGAERFISDAAFSADGFYRLDKRVRAAGLDSVLGGSMTKKKLIKAIGELVENE